MVLFYSRKNVKFISGLLFAICLLSFAGIVQTRPSKAADAQYFIQTGHSVSGKFLQYWQTNGGLATFGYPITDARTEVDPETGKTFLTQWFERNRFELHPENAGTAYEVLLGLLGKDLNRDRLNSGQFARTGNNGTGNYLLQTGHNLNGRFLDYWNNNGGLNRFGFPISEEFSEVDPETGKTFVVQWFERARFERHPENARPYDVLLGLLGKQIKGGNQPTSGKILYGGADNGIYLINPDGTDKTRIATGNNPIFSANGNQIAYVTSSGTQFGEPPYKAKIVTANRDGSNSRETCVSGDDQGLLLNSWSPDGNFFSVSQFRLSIDLAGLPMSVCNLNTRTITPPPLFVQDVRNILDWAPDGNNFLFQYSSDGNDFGLFYGPGANQTGSHQVTEGQYRGPAGINQDGLFYSQARISPDGTTIAIVGSKLFTVNVPDKQGSIASKVFDVGSILNLAWSPDSRSLVFITYDDKYNLSLKTLSLTDGTVTQIDNSIASDGSYSVGWK